MVPSLRDADRQRRDRLEVVDERGEDAVQRLRPPDPVPLARVEPEIEPGVVVIEFDEVPAPDLPGEVEAGVAGIEDCPPVVEVVRLIEAPGDVLLREDEDPVPVAAPVFVRRLVLVVDDDVDLARVAEAPERIEGEDAIRAAVCQDEGAEVIAHGVKPFDAPRGG